MAWSRTHTPICNGEAVFQPARPCLSSPQLIKYARLGSAGGVCAAPRVQLVSKSRLVQSQYRQGDDGDPAAPLPPATAPAHPPVAPPALTSSPVPISPSVGTPAARAQLKIIGLGLRGISAVNRLIGSGSLPEAEFWSLDSDKRVLATADVSTRALEVGPGDDASLSQADLLALSGGTTAPAAPEAPDGHAGAVFVLGSAFGSPGGAPMLLQLVRHLRRQGYFVAAALTRPFEFEGARRLEAADTLISAMEEVAHLVVVVAQGVLTRASAELTMGQAEAIADNTLVYTVQSTLWALRAPEVLKVSHGAFLWHGRDLRNIRRPLFPPMMNLLSVPGQATLGRGQAALPLPLLQQAGLASALSTLAEDAVKAASESPFLDNKLESATGVLCVLRVPPSALGVAPFGAGGSRGSEGGVGGAGSNVANGGPLVADNHKEYALRSAVQVAAMTVKDLVGPHCHDIIVCPQLCHDLEDQGPRQQPKQQQAAPGGAGRQDGSNGGGGGAAAASGEAAVAGAAQQGAPPSGGGPIVRVEVSLLVLERIEEAAEPKSIAGQKAPGEASITASAAIAAAAAGYSSPAPAALTAATARDRITSVINPRAPSTPPKRRLPRPGAPTTASSYFSGQLPHPSAPAPPAGQAAAPASTPSLPGTQPPWTGAADPTASGRAAPVAPPGSHLSAGAAAPAAAAPAAAAAAAEANRARKQARLAAMSAMSALAGGTASSTGIAGGSGQAAAAPGPPGAGSVLGAVPSARAAGGLGSAAAVAGGAQAGVSPPGLASGAGGLSARGHPQPYAPHLPQAHCQAAQQPTDPVAHDADGGGGLFGLQQIPRMAESLQVTSLVAQSLDLPPQAARWRHQKRAPNKRGAGSAVFNLPKVDADLEAEDTWLEEGGGQGDGIGRGLQQLIAGMRLPGLGSDGAAAGGQMGPAAVRNRVAGMLDLERKDLWAGPGGV